MRFQIGSPRVLRRVRFSVRASSGEELFFCETNQRGACDSARTFHHGPGAFVLIAQAWTRQGVESPAVELRYDLRGDEQELTAALTTFAQQSPATTTQLELEARIAPVPGLRLDQTWRVGADRTPTYNLYNNSGQTIFGGSFLENFFGFVEREQRPGVWRVVERGGMCGTVGPGVPLSPSNVASSIEGYFIGGAIPFRAGRYRYVLYVADQMPVRARTVLPDGSDVYTTFRRLSSLHSEFTIAAP